MRVSQPKRYRSFIDLPFAVYLQAKRDKAKIWHEFVATDFGKQWDTRNNRDSFKDACDLASYFWG